ncbi:MAG TPA: CARDB domain-containing protein [Candidatus Thermoplasmatota archaeon]|nr:CARDB domain-containing protein [Candidatus Thermoplasmatota archaeon]
MRGWVSAAVVVNLFLAGCALPSQVAGTPIALECFEGQACARTLSIEGGQPPYACALAPGSAVPEPFALSGCNLTGTPSLLAAGSTRSVLPAFAVTVTDNATPPRSETLAVTLSIVAAPPRLLPVVGAFCVVDVPCDGNARVATGQGGVPPYHFQSDTFREGAPPLGVVVGVDGIMTGIARQVGVFVFPVCVVDSVAKQDCGPVTLAVRPANDTPPSCPCEPLPDLLVTRILWDPAGTLREGDEVAFGARVDNVGQAPAGPFAILLELDGTFLRLREVESLAPGAYAAAVATWRAVAGSHTLRAVADSGDAVAESDETNNERTEALVVDARDPPPPPPPAQANAQILSVSCSRSFSHYESFYETTYYDVEIQAQGAMAGPTGTQIQARASIRWGSSAHSVSSREFEASWSRLNAYARERTAGDPAEGTWTATWRQDDWASKPGEYARVTLTLVVPRSDGGRDVSDVFSDRPC